MERDDQQRESSGPRGNADAAPPPTMKPPDADKRAAPAATEIAETQETAVDVVVTSQAEAPASEPPEAPEPETQGAATEPEEQGAQQLCLRAGTATSVGRVRSQNQDALVAMTLDLRDDLPDGLPMGLYLVADGMGGEAHGEIASRIAARVVTAEFVTGFFMPRLTAPAARGAEAPEPAPETSTTDLGTALGDALTHAVETANDKVRALSEQLGMPTGTTLTALAVWGSQGVVVHVGDSRAYLLHGDTLYRVTEDHSLMARLEAMQHPLLEDPSFMVSRSILYRSLGQEDDTPPDVIGVPLTVGDRVLICSDGMWDELDDQTIGLALAGVSDPERCAQELVDLANAAGGNDNSSAVVLFVELRAADAAAAAEGEPSASEREDGEPTGDDTARLDVAPDITVE